MFPKETFSRNPSHNTLEIYHIFLAQVQFTTSETIFYFQYSIISLLHEFHDDLSTQELRKCGSNRGGSKAQQCLFSLTEIKPQQQQSKIDTKFFQPCSILLDFPTLFRIFPTKSYERVLFVFLNHYTTVYDRRPLLLHT